jgi:twitching motility two-component system response regulator PilH
MAYLNTPRHLSGSQLGCAIAVLVLGYQRQGFVRLMKILIVDDSPAEVRLMQSVLDRAGYTSIAVHDPMRLEQMIDMERPNLILLDVVMPQRNGFQACRELKGNAVYARIPVVMVSSKNTESDKFWAKEQGADGYVVKPFSNDELLGTVRSLVGKH